MSHIESPLPVLDDHNVLTFRILHQLFLMKECMCVSAYNKINVAYLRSQILILTISKV